MNDFDLNQENFVFKKTDFKLKQFFYEGKNLRIINSIDQEPFSDPWFGTSMVHFYSSKEIGPSDPDREYRPLPFQNMVSVYRAEKNDYVYHKIFLLHGKMVNPVHISCYWDGIADSLSKSRISTFSHLVSDYLLDDLNFYSIGSANNLNRISEEDDKLVPEFKPRYIGKSYKQLGVRKHAYVPSREDKEGFSMFFSDHYCRGKYTDIDGWKMHKCGWNYEKESLRIVEMGEEVYYFKYKIKKISDKLCTVPFYPIDKKRKKNCWASLMKNKKICSKRMLWFNNKAMVEVINGKAITPKKELSVIISNEHIEEGEGKQTGLFFVKGFKPLISNCKIISDFFGKKVEPKMVKKATIISRSTRFGYKYKKIKGLTHSESRILIKAAEINSGILFSKSCNKKEALKALTLEKTIQSKGDFGMAFEGGEKKKKERKSLCSKRIFKVKKKCKSLNYYMLKGKRSLFKPKWRRKKNENKKKGRRKKKRWRKKHKEPETGENHLSKKSLKKCNLIVRSWKRWRFLANRQKELQTGKDLKVLKKPEVREKKVKISPEEKETEKQVVKKFDATKRVSEKKASEKLSFKEGTKPKCVVKKILSENKPLEEKSIGKEKEKEKETLKKSNAEKFKSLEEKYEEVKRRKEAEKRKENQRRKEQGWLFDELTLKTYAEGFNLKINETNLKKVQEYLLRNNVTPLS